METSIYAFSTDQEWKHVEDIPLELWHTEEDMKLAILSDQKLLMVDMLSGEVWKVAVEGKSCYNNTSALVSYF